MFSLVTWFWFFFSPYGTYILKHYFLFKFTILPGNLLLITWYFLIAWTKDGCKASIISWLFLCKTGTKNHYIIPLFFLYKFLFYKNQIFTYNYQTCTSQIFILQKLNFYLLPNLYVTIFLLYKNQILYLQLPNLYVTNFYSTKTKFFTTTTKLVRHNFTQQYSNVTVQPPKLQSETLNNTLNLTIY